MIEIIKSLAEMAQNYGLGILLSVSMLVMFYFIVKKLLSSHESHINTLVKIINQKDNTVDNHINHVYDTLNNNEKVLIEQRDNIKSGFDKIENAINVQSEWMKENITNQNRLIDYITKEDKNESK